MTEGIITEIQRGSVHDGPGLRTVVFLKGCNLRCFWCHNPEAIRPEPEPWFDSAKCLKCGRCGARRDAEKCLTGALSICGRTCSAGKAFCEVMDDAPFFRESGGGVTISGGEPGCRPEFTAELLRMCREAGIHTAIETNLSYPLPALEQITEHCELVMADLKHIDPGAHRRGTGADNTQIMSNLRMLKKPLVLRTPVIPGFNDSPETIREIAEFASRLPTLLRYELLSYHPLGRAKAEKLGMDAWAQPLPQPRTTMPVLLNAALESGVTVDWDGREWKN